jgi:hypothetical protein
MAQSTMLPPTDHEAALSCAAASRRIAAAPTIENYVSTMYFVVMAASEGDPHQMQDRITEFSTQTRDRAEKTGSSEAIATLAECRMRFPVAWQTAPAVLPRERLTRTVMCFVTNAFYRGMMRDGSLTGSDIEFKRVDQLYERIFKALQAQPRPAGFDTPVQFATQFTASLKLGNLLSISAACEAAYPA